MPKRIRGLPRAVGVAIILIAAALVLLRPLCESWHAGTWSHASGIERTAASSGLPAMHAGGTSVDACCSSVDGAVAPAGRAVSFGRGGDSPSLALPVLPGASIALPQVVHAVFPRRALPRIPRSYYLRSARILR
jgi:hypothetical protein